MVHNLNNLNVRVVSLSLSLSLSLIYIYIYIYTLGVASIIYSFLLITYMVKFRQGEMHKTPWHVFKFLST